MTRFLSVPFAARDWHPELRNLRCFTDPLANPKLEYLRKQVAERIKKGKVVVASGIYASGITRALDEGEDEHAIAALFERWFPGKVLRIDGATEDRDSVVDRWRNDPDARILIASVPAAAESLNFTLGYVRGSVEKITVFYLSLPWKPTQYLQFNGRFRRPGGEVPVETMILVVDGTADEALLELNERKWKNFLTGVHGMPILAEEEKAIEESTFQRLTVTPSAWLRDAFAKMLGLGEIGIQKLHTANLHGLPIERTIAEYYLACEEQGTAGQVARVTAPMLQRWKESGVIPEWEDVLDVGCGPLVLERRVNAPLHAIDINPMMITVGATRSYHGGRNAISGCASRMPDEWTDRFGFIIASLMLDLTSARKGKGGIERVKVLQEFHRVLKPGGHLWCVFQERCFEPSSLTRFTQALEAYGFERVDPWCNQIEALDQRPHTFRFWSVLLRKKSDLRLVDPPCPLFEQELDREGVEVKGKGVRNKPAPPHPPGEIVQHELFAIRDQFAGKVSLEEAALLLIPLRSPYEDLHRIMVDRFRIRSVAVVERLRAELDRQRPQSLSDMKHIWRTIRDLPEAPRVKWEQMAKVTKPFFKAS